MPQELDLEHWPLVRPFCSIPTFLNGDPCWRTCYSSMRCWISMSWQLVIACQMTWQSALCCAAWMDPRGDNLRWSWMKGWTAQSSRTSWSCWRRTQKRGLVTISWRICRPSTGLRPQALPTTKVQPLWKWIRFRQREKQVQRDTERQKGQWVWFAIWWQTRWTSERWRQRKTKTQRRERKQGKE